MSECLDQKVLGDVNGFSEVLLNRQRMREETTKEAAGQRSKGNQYK